MESEADKVSCPKCNSNNTHFCPTPKKWVCDDCLSVFSIQQEKKALRIFVSYGHDEYLIFAKHVAKSLQEKGHSVWFDEERLKPGGDWEGYIEDGINWVAQNRTNGRVLLIMTPYSIRRPDGYCLNEIAKALDNKLSIIPVMLVWATPPLSIYRLQYLNLLHSNNKQTITESFENDFSKICLALEQTNYLETQGELIHLKEELEPLDFSADLILSQTWFTGRKWVFDEITTWLKSPDASKVFWLTGIPGMGKTAIATELFQRFPNIIALHLCRRGHSEKSSPKRAICSIVYQMSTQLPEYRNILQKIDIKKEIDRCSNSALFDVLIIQPFSIIDINPTAPLVILIDALDESSVHGSNEIARFINTEFEKLPKWIRIIITSRPDRECIVNLQRFNPYQIDPNRSENNIDLKEYIAKRLKEKSNNNDLDKIAKTIITRSEGSFLYVKCMCDDIVNDIMKDVSDYSLYPIGMDGFYHNYFFDKFDVDSYQNNIRPVLEVMISLFEPLEINDLKSILQWNNYQIQNFLRGIGSFVTTPNNKVIPFHASLFDWLEDDNKSNIYWVDREQGIKNLIKWAEEKESFYSYKYLGKHYVEINDNKSLYNLLSNINYFIKQQEVIGYDYAISLYLELLAALPIKERNNLFSSKVFFVFLYDNRTILYDKALFQNLKDLGFNPEFIITQGTESYVLTVILHFWYTTMNYQQIFNHREIFESIQENKGTIFDILGLTLKKIGDIHAALNYLKIAQEICLAKKSSDSIFIYVNIARIEILQLKFEDSLSSWELANTEFSTIDNKVDKFEKRQLEIALRYVKLEIELFSPNPDLASCEEQIKWFDNLYSNKILRDRYYSRHMQIAALYDLINCNIESCKLRLKECENVLSNNYERIKQLYYESIVDYCCDSDINLVKNHIIELLSQTKTLPVEYFEALALGSLVGVEDNMKRIDYNLNLWKEYLANHFMKIKEICKQIK